MTVAIYSRKSVFTGKGESIENQVEMCKEYYIKMYGKNVEFVIYEDEGFSGGNTNRPKFKQLLKDIKAKKLSALICYRLDRISRNVADFSATLELLQENNCDFISIKEQFDTSTPMGRAMVYISSVFAQLERETIAERIRDNMHQLAKTGRWLGGQTPLGFDAERITYIDEEFKERSMCKLSPLDEELKLVKFIFEKYHETGSIHKVLKHLLANNLKGKNGGDFASMSVNDILRNPVYVKSDDKVLEYLSNKGINISGTPNGNGILVYNKKNSKYKDKDISEWIASISKHKGVINSELWLSVQRNLDKNAKKDNPRQGTSKKALLSGVLKCAKCGAPMRINYGREKSDGTKVYYYMCTMKAHSCKTRCDNPNAKGDLLENQIIEKLMNYKTNDLIPIFKKHMDNLNESGILDLSKNIKKDLESKKQELNNLISQFSKITNETAQEFTLKAIDNLGNEIKKLEVDLENANTTKGSLNLEIQSIELVMSDLLEFQKIYADIKDVNDIKDEGIILNLRRLLERIVPKITFDGETNDVELHMWDVKKN